MGTGTLTDETRSGQASPGYLPNMSNSFLKCSSFGVILKFRDNCDYIYRLCDIVYTWSSSANLTTSQRALVVLAASSDWCLRMPTTALDRMKHSIRTVRF